jgi:hypothetical protein
MENISLSAWEAHWLVVVLTFLLLMTLIRSKRLKQADPTFSFLLGSGSSLVLYSGLCLAVQLLS